jgi:hypothetical protein
MSGWTYSNNKRSMNTAHDTEDKREKIQTLRTTTQINYQMPYLRRRMKGHHIIVSIFSLMPHLEL